MKRNYLTKILLTIVAIFTLQSVAAATATAVAIAEEGGLVSIDGSEYSTRVSVPLEIGSTVIFRVTPSDGYKFEYWTNAAGEEVSTSTACSISIMEDVTLTAHFRVAPLVKATATEGGSVSLDDSYPSSVVTEVVEIGTEVEFSAFPDDGYEFKCWTDILGYVISSNAIFITPINENLTLTANFAEIPKDKDISEDTEETTDKTYENVTIEPNDSGEASNWIIGTNKITCNSVNIVVAADGTAPEIKISGDGLLVASNTTITHAVAGNEWKIISLPFAFNLSDIRVNGAYPSYGNNVVIQVYDAAKRANSYEGWSVSGWESKTSGTIEANQGFAIGVDAEIGETKSVVFTSSDFTSYTNDDQAIALDLNPSDVNDGMDANWNLIGTPLLEGSTQGDGYVLYIYNAKSNDYKEYASGEKGAITPHGGLFLQSAEGFESLTFSAGAEVNRESEGFNNRVILTINGDDDEAKMFVADGASNEFVINEDAMYFSPLGNKVSQIYYVDQDNKAVAASVVADIAESTKITYKALVAGTQSIAMTTDVTDKALYLQDTVTGESVLMTDGAIYEFESESGTFTNRFTLVAVGEVTGIESAVSSNVKVVASNSAITVIGAETGADIAVYSANGTQIYQGVITSQNETIAISAQGVAIVKVGAEIFKVVAK